MINLLKIPFRSRWSQNQISVPLLFTKTSYVVVWLWYVHTYILSNNLHHKYFLLWHWCLHYILRNQSFGYITNIRCLGDQFPLMAYRLHKQIFRSVKSLCIHPILSNFKKETKVRIKTQVLVCILNYTTVDDKVWCLVFWDVAPCTHIEVDRRFRGAYYLHHQDEWALQSQSHVTTDGQSVGQSWCRVPSGTHDQIFSTL
jgi:hypothetical protein